MAWAINGGYGNWIRINHADRLTTVYGHLSRFAPGLEAGSMVVRGELIGFVGSTGRSTGAQLLSAGRWINPMGQPVTQPHPRRGRPAACAGSCPAGPAPRPRQ